MPHQNPIPAFYCSVTIKFRYKSTPFFLKRDVLKHTSIDHLVLAQEETEEEGDNGEDNSMYEGGKIRGRTTVLVVLQSKQPFPFALWRKCEKHTGTQYKEEECSSPGTYQAFFDVVIVVHFIICKVFLKMHKLNG